MEKFEANKVLFKGFSKAKYGKNMVEFVEIREKIIVEVLVKP